MRRRPVLLLYILCAAMLLSGCTGNLFSSRRDMERLRPVQTIGLDRHGGGVTLSLSTSTGPDGAPALAIRTDGAGIEDSIARAQDWSPEDELFYAHVRYILLGEGMADGVMPVLDWVERSPAMRLGTAMLIVRGSAGDAVADATGEEADVSTRLASLEREERSRGVHIYTLREIAADILERGAALCVAVQSVPDGDAVLAGSHPDSAALLPTGYAVLREDAPPVFLTENETFGAQLMTFGADGAHLDVDGCTLSVITGTARAAGQRDADGALTGISITCRLRAGILERAGDEPPDALEAALTEAVRARLEAATARSQALGCDFLNLKTSVLRGASPDDEARWDEMFPSLPVTVSVDARLDRSYDLSY